MKTLEGITVDYLKLEEKTNTSAVMFFKEFPSKISKINSEMIQINSDMKYISQELDYAKKAQSEPEPKTCFLFWC